jgi:hypothetical protein
MEAIASVTSSFLPSSDVSLHKLPAMKKLLILAVLVSSLSSSFAELTASHTAAIEKLLTVMETEKVMAKSLAIGLKAGLGVSEDQIKSLPKEQQDKFNSAMEKVMAAVMAEMSWENLKPGLVAAYGRNFTEKEALEVAALMQTPAGKLYVSKQADVAVDIATITQERMKVLTPKIMQIMQSEMQK